MRMLLLRAATVSALLVVPLALHAQTREITGRVMSRDTQEPLNNVEIVVVGQSARLGTYTNDQGRYRIVLNTGDATLRLRRLGYHNAIWHGFVLAAAACHYAAVLLGVVLPRA